MLVIKDILIKIMINIKKGKSEVMLRKGPLTFMIMILIKMTTMRMMMMINVKNVMIEMMLIMMTIANHCTPVVTAAASVPRSVI